MADRFMKLSVFARHLGRSPSYVTKLKDQGRLALTADGRVKVRQSMELIEATRGSRDDVAERHHAARTAEKNGAEVSEPAPDKNGAPDAEEIAGELTVKEVAMRIKLAEMRDKEASSRMREIEALAKQGEYIARDDVDAAMKFIGATVRSLLDVFPDQVAPVVAPTSSLDECHALLQEICRDVLFRLGEAIERQKAALEGGG